VRTSNRDSIEWCTRRNPFSPGFILTDATLREADGLFDLTLTSNPEQHVQKFTRARITRLLESERLRAVGPAK
jgi:hypothetical protein